MSWFLSIYMSLFGSKETPLSVEKSKEKVEEIQQDSKMSPIVELSRHSAFAAEKLPEATSATIEENGKVVAQQTLVKFSPNQAYCVLSEFDTRFDDSEIRVQEKETPLEMKLVSIEKEKINKHLLPVFVRFHHSLKQRSAESHLSDRSFENVLGRMNLELKKNVTMDSFDRIDSWRDEAGFIVTDRNQYQHNTYETKELLKELTPDNSKITPFLPSDLEAVLDFDHSVCGANRESLVETLAKEGKMYLAKTGPEVHGMIVGKGERIFSLYAETIELAHSLIKFYIEQQKLSTVSFFTRCEVWQSAPSQSRPVYRYHTRTVPSQLKWNKIYVANIGVHLC